MDARPDERASRRIHALVSGRVQGVYYRSSAQTQARALGLHGWVRNLPDGRVELMAEGPADAVQCLLAWASQGPPGAWVEDLEVEDEEPEGTLSPFTLEPTPP